jgi:hypothetical protein
MRNDYKNYNISNYSVHVGNGAKDALKKENKLCNFKFYYKVDNSYKNCSAGFDNISEFINFIKPIDNKYYMFEYIFDNKKCIPYFDYEYEINKRPSDKELGENLNNVNKLIKEVFDEIFKIKLDDKNIIITSSHGFKSADIFKVSYHIIITGYYFESNFDCEYIYNKLKESDKNFDGSVYSKDRMMRCVLSAKDWDDQRILIPVNNSKITINDLDKYLITNVQDAYIKLKCPLVIKKQVNKKIYERKVNKEQEPNEIGTLIESIVKKNFHEDSYFIKSVMKYENINFYAFNYSNRNEECFTGSKHDRIGFYCYLDGLSNILLKCFSANCKNCKKVIGNLYEDKIDDNAIIIDTQYLNNNIIFNEKLYSFKKTLLVKSAMNTGKTQIVCDYIDKFKPKRILWISTRQTYSHNVLERIKKLGFINYLDDKKDFYLKDKIVVQLESLHKLEQGFNIGMFDLVILDEIESILYQFDSSTIYEYSENTFNLLYLLCKNKTTKLIMMDGDLGKRTMEYAKDIDTNYDIFINKYISDEIIIKMTNNKDYFLNKIIDSIAKKRKICIISLTTKIMAQLEKILIEKKIKYLSITSNSDDKIKKDLANVNELWIQYEVVLYSPTISVGVDFTVEYFDDVYSIVIPNVASPRIYKQMLGRLRKMKNKEILCYYKTMDSNMDSKLYNYEEMVKYFKYCDPEIKTKKKYKLNKINHTIEVVSNFTLYDRIMMHNKIENMNKNVGNFMTELNHIMNKSNYKIVFLDKPVENRKAPELYDDAFKEKIIDAKNINVENDNDASDNEFHKIHKKILTNDATEAEKFSYQKHKFKQFWNLTEVNDLNMDLYFRQEFVLNRLQGLMGKMEKDKEYLDYNVGKKIEVINNIINTLGFDLKNLNNRVSKDDYYKNLKSLLSKENNFTKNYDNIRILFEKDRHKLDEKLKGPAIAKLLNGFLSDFGLYIICKQTTKKENDKIIATYYYILGIDEKFKEYVL